MCFEEIIPKLFMTNILSVKKNNKMWNQAVTIGSDRTQSNDSFSTSVS
jgi:hypothetical protein